MAETEQEERYEDEHFRMRKKHKNVIIDCPHTFAPIADTHAHLNMLADPALALARAGVHDVAFIEAMVDPSEGDTVTYAKLDEWRRDAELFVRKMGSLCCGQAPYRVPEVRIAAGVHPHNAKLYDEALEAELLDLLRDPRTSAVGEIGLDYHYDLSPREVQREVFARQVEIAKEAGLPVILHMREAHDDGFDIMQRVGFPEAGTLLHCYNLGPEELERWIEAGCFVAFGGALTFKKNDEVRRASLLVPQDKLLSETDSPYMTPEPMRSLSCEPAHVVWVCTKLADIRLDDDLEPRYSMPSPGDEQRIAFQEQLYRNARSLLDRPPTAWQRGESNA